MVCLFLQDKSRLLSEPRRSSTINVLVFLALQYSATLLRLGLYLPIHGIQNHPGNVFVLIIRRAMSRHEIDDGPLAPALDPHPAILHVCFAGSLVGVDQAAQNRLFPTIGKPVVNEYFGIVFETDAGIEFLHGGLVR